MDLMKIGIIFQITTLQSMSKKNRQKYLLN